MFVALDLPDRVREEIAAWGREELADPALRPVPAETLHITLAFLGWRRQRTWTGSRRREECVGGGAAGGARGPGRRPEARRARLIALPALSGTGGQKQGEARLRALADVRAALRAGEAVLLAALTVARVRPPRSADRAGRWQVESPSGRVPHGPSDGSMASD